MPDVAQFLNGFGLIQGSSFDGYILTIATSTHESIKRYQSPGTRNTNKFVFSQEYKYSITLTFDNQGSGNYNDLFQHVMQLISQQPIIYGIKNPYKCLIDPPNYGDISEDDNKTITFNLIGHSHRVYKQ